MMNETEQRKTKPSGALCRSERVVGCLLGGAVGDALGAPIEFMTLPEIRKKFGPEGLKDYSPAYGRLGAITDDTQMTLFTAEGLLRAACRMEHKGICNPQLIVYLAYLRWLKTQGYESKSDLFGLATTNNEPNGWLIDVKDLHSRRGPGNTCLSALKSDSFGITDGQPINDSKGCGGVMRAAPAGIVPDAVEQAFRLGCETSAITHGHPTGWLAGGALAVIVHTLLRGQSIRDATSEALRLLKEDRRSGECRAALEAAVELAGREQPTAEKLTTLGGGWIAEEALAIGVYAALVAGTFQEGVLLAVNHGGDSDSTGSIAGNILGAALGRKAIPKIWLERLELKDVIETISADLVTAFEETDEWWRRYPGC